MSTKFLKTVAQENGKISEREFSDYRLFSEGTIWNAGHILRVNEHFGLGEPE